MLEVRMNSHRSLDANTKRKTNTMTAGASKTVRTVEYVNNLAVNCNHPTSATLLSYPMTVTGTKCVLELNGTDNVVREVT